MSDGGTIGQPVKRKEDIRLLTGRGRFTDDINRPGQAYAVVLRSPHAHARIASIETRAARGPGILAILTGADYAADGLKGMQHGPVGVDHFDITKPAFPPEAIPHGALPPQPPVAQGRVRFVGEAVALIVAETLEAARDAAERIEVRYEPLPAATDVAAAMAAGAAPLWDERPDNLLLEGERGDAAATDAAFAKAHRIVRLTSLNQRISGAPMEPRSGVAEYDPATGQYTIHAVSQGAHRVKISVALCLGVPQDKVRAITGDVGGGFGVRSAAYTENALIAWAARKTGRPVKWTSTRSEAFLADFQARDVVVEGALALQRDGKFLGLRLAYRGNIGAYPVSLTVLNNVSRMAAGVYDIPAIHVRLTGVATNTALMSVFRGAGRPESNFMMERLIELASAELGIERVELRRRNIIAETALPYQSPLGHRYDTGAFAANMERALRMVDWAGFPARRTEAGKSGRLRGIGIANYLETPTGFVDERTDITVLPEGRVTAVIGTQASGQGHETVFAQVVGEKLQVPLEKIDVLFGDTGIAVSGGGTHSDRSMRLGGAVLVEASAAIVERGRKFAAAHFEAAESDIVYEHGSFTVAGTDRSLGLFEAAGKTELAATATIGRRLHAYPNGAAACEVEIDPETGAVTILRYVTVDDVGRVINPMIVEGQIHGGATQSIGQALMERIVFDEGGQLLTGSFLDYPLPHADELPNFAVAQNEIAATSNALGVKGAGEAGVTPGTSAVINAIVDALKEFGVSHIEMPATPERVWRAMRRRQ